MKELTLVSFYQLGLAPTHACLFSPLDPIALKIHCLVCLLIPALTAAFCLVSISPQNNTSNYKAASSTYLYIALLLLQTLSILFFLGSLQQYSTLD